MHRAPGPGRDDREQVQCKLDAYAAAVFGAPLRACDPPSKKATGKRKQQPSDSDGTDDETPKMKKTKKKGK